MDITNNALFEDSFYRCCGSTDNDVAFVNYFYSHLKGTDDRIAGIFDKFPVHHQVHAVRSAVYLLSDYYSSKIPSEEFERIIGTHTHKRLGLEPYMLDVWLDCLLDTVREFDQKCDKDVLTAWDEKLRPGIDYLKNLLPEQF